MKCAELETWSLILIKAKQKKRRRGERLNKNKNTIQHKSVLMALNPCTFFFSFHFVPSGFSYDCHYPRYVRSVGHFWWCYCCFCRYYSCSFHIQYKFDQIRRHTTTALGIIDMVSLHVCVFACWLGMPSGALCAIYLTGVESTAMIRSTILCAHPNEKAEKKRKRRLIGFFCLILICLTGQSPLCVCAIWLFAFQFILSFFFKLEN